MFIHNSIPMLFLPDILPDRQLIRLLDLAESMGFREASPDEGGNGSRFSPSPLVNVGKETIGKSTGKWKKP